MPTDLWTCGVCGHDTAHPDAVCGPCSYGLRIGWWEAKTKRIKAVCWGGTD